MDWKMLQEIMDKVKGMDQTQKRMLRMMRVLKRKGRNTRRKLDSFIRKGEEAEGLKIDTNDNVEKCTYAHQQVHQVSQANDKFNVNLYDKIIQDRLIKPDNLIISAFSVSTMLLLLASGAKGKTQGEIIDGLQFLRFYPFGPIYPFGEGYRCILPQLESDDFTLSAANGIFLQRGFSPKVKFLDAEREFFHSEILETNFARPKSAAKRI